MRITSGAPFNPTCTRPSRTSVPSPLDFAGWGLSASVSMSSASSERVPSNASFSVSCRSEPSGDTVLPRLTSVLSAPSVATTVMGAAPRRVSVKLSALLPSRMSSSAKRDSRMLVPFGSITSRPVPLNTALMALGRVTSSVIVCWRTFTPSSTRITSEPAGRVSMATPPVAVARTDNEPAGSPSRDSKRIVEPSTVTSARKPCAASACAATREAMFAAACSAVAAPPVPSPLTVRSFATTV